MAFCGDQYYEKIHSIQQSMHEREKIRLELERELFAYSRSDKRISQIKCAKLRDYLRELSERETQAKMRNLELLRDVECVEMSMKGHCLDCGPLHQHKADVSHRRLQDESRPLQRPPPALFTACQTAGESAAEDTATSVHSRPAAHRPLHRQRTHSPEHPPSGLLKVYLSDDISGSNGSPDGCNLSDKHERAAVVTSVRVSAAVAHSVSRRGDDGDDDDDDDDADDEHAPSPPLTLTSPERKASSPSRDSPADTHSREAVHQQQPTEEDAGRRPRCSTPQTELERDSRDVAGGSESISLSSSKLSVSSESELSVSLTDSELEEEEEEEPAKGVARRDSTSPTATRGATERSAPPGGSDSHSLCSRESSFHSQESKSKVQVERDSLSPEALSERLSPEGLFHLFGSIEERICGKHTDVYRDSSVGRRECQEIISLCNGRAGLNDEDLEACGAVVLQELQRLSWSTSRGCLLPQELVSAHRAINTGPEDISSSLPPDAVRLWDRWFKHALLLKELHVLSTERLVQLFTPLLLERRAAAYSHQAKELVRTLLCWSSEESPSEEEEEEGESPPSLLEDRGELQSAGPEEDHSLQELQSAEEDRQDESPVESIPIRETKAYQLLKQSATRERLPSSGEEEEEEEEEENGLSGINEDHEVDSGRDKHSSHQDPRKEKTNCKPLSAVQSKAFWGESDDSDSEIEAALRPQPFYREAAASDDFYD